LQEQEFERVGGNDTLKTNVRVIAATNAELKELIAEKKFRADLYYRLNVIPIHLPPLRDRQDDILPLTLFFIQRYAAKNRKKIARLSEESVQALMHYSFPGNVRELEHLVERAVVTAQHETLHIEVPQDKSYPEPLITLPISLNAQQATHFPTLEELERTYILNTCTRLNWRIRGKEGIAETLGINPSTLESRMRKMGIARPK
jgi:transcriptional regulator with GAF, ATPase, and Fis domain